MSEELFPKLFDERQVAKLCRVSRRTVQGWRYCKTGPAYTKTGGKVFYADLDVLAFLCAHKINPTKRLSGGRTRVTWRGEQGPRPQPDYKCQAAADRDEDATI